MRPRQLAPEAVLFSSIRVSLNAKLVVKMEESKVEGANGLERLLR